MMISPFDPEWYPNIVSLIDTPGEWLQYMKSSCRPVWVLFGDFNQQKSSDAIESLSLIASNRGYHEDDNPEGDVQFVYSNIKKQVIEEDQEFGAPSTASWASVRSTPTHVLYIAGMEYKRYWGVVDSQVIDVVCDELVEVMGLFRQNSGNFDRCSGTFGWSGSKAQAYGGSPSLAVDGEAEPWEGSVAQAYGGDPTLVVDPVVDEWQGAKSQAYSGTPTLTVDIA